MQPTSPTPFDHPQDLVIHGLAIRTSPERAATDIPAHWQAAMAGGLPARGEIYAVYCDYESDFRGAYTLVLGTVVAPDAPLPEGYRRVRIPAGHYAAFTATGDPTAVVWQTWMHINSAWEGRHRRRYIADYERYTAMSADSVTAEIALGIA